MRLRRLDGLHAPQLSPGSIAMHEVTEVPQFLGDVVFHAPSRFLPPLQGVVVEEELRAKRTGLQRILSDKLIPPVREVERCLDTRSRLAEAVECAAWSCTSRLSRSVLGVSARDPVLGLPDVKEARLRRDLVANVPAIILRLKHCRCELDDIHVSTSPPSTALLCITFGAML